MKSILLVILLCLYCSTSYADIATGLVGWWKFDDNSTTTALDSSGSANTATLGHAPTVAAGHIGSHAITFNGTTQYGSTSTVTNIPTVQGNQTLSAWVNESAAPVSARDIVDIIDGATSANQLRISTGGDAEVSKWGGTYVLQGTAATAVSINVWHMITYTWDGTTNTIYIDGVSKLTGNTAHQTGAATVVFIAAYGTTSGNENFNGTIDDVRIYNRALTANDITQLYDYYTGRNGLFTLMAN